MNKQIEELIERVRLTDEEIKKANASVRLTDEGGGIFSMHIYDEQRAIAQKVECPDCAWSQFVGEEGVAMTPCNSCNSTGFITTVIPLAEAINKEVKS